MKGVRFFIHLLIPLIGISSGDVDDREPYPDVDSLPYSKESPDMLVLNDGTRADTKEKWERRRIEIKDLLQHYATGTIPPPPRSVTGIKTGELKNSDGTVRAERYTVQMDQNNIPGFDFILLIPERDRDIKLPVIVNPGFSRPLLNEAMNSRESLDQLVKTYQYPLSRGYAVATFYFQDCGSDNAEFRESSYFTKYPAYDWGVLAGWAWGMSRCADVLLQHHRVDESKLIVMGHSRIGKAALIAGAFDERFALTVSAGSGCGGTGSYRHNGRGRGGKEGIEDIVANFPQWFTPEFHQFAGNVHQLPFDQDWFVALVAPRRFIATDGAEDRYTSNNAVAVTIESARRVFCLLQVPDHIVLNIRSGGHEVTVQDWRAILKECDTFCYP